MPYVATRPTLIVEGHGDVDAVPALVLRVCHHLQCYALSVVRPAIRGATLPKFKDADQVRRYVSLAALRDGSDSIVIALDCDDACAKDEVASLTTILRPLAAEINKKIGVCYFVREFEAIFLHSLDELSASHPDLQIQLPCPVAPAQIETVRDAKGLLSRQMNSGSYKETRDQQQFVHATDIGKLIQTSRSVRHFASCMQFLHDEESPLVYPY